MLMVSNNAVNLMDLVIKNLSLWNDKALRVQLCAVRTTLELLSFPNTF